MRSLQGQLHWLHHLEESWRAGRDGCNPIQCTQNKQKGNLSENYGVTIDTGEANYRQNAGKRSDTAHLAREKKALAWFIWGSMSNAQQLYCSQLWEHSTMRTEAGGVHMNRMRLSFLRYHSKLRKRGDDMQGIVQSSVWTLSISRPQFFLFSLTKESLLLTFHIMLFLLGSQRDSCWIPGRRPRCNQENVCQRRSIRVCHINHAIEERSTTARTTVNKTVRTTARLTRRRLKVKEWFAEADIRHSTSDQRKIPLHLFTIGFQKPGNCADSWFLESNG